MQRVLILQNEQDDPEGFLGQLMDGYAIPRDIIDVENDALPDPTHYTAIVSLGGSQHAYDEHLYPYLVAEKALIRQAVQQNIPVLGLCLGGQLLAAALDGQVKRHTMTEIGFFDVSLTQSGQEDPLFAGLPGYQRVFHWHEDTFDLPAGAVLLASNGNTENQAFRYGQHAYGLQYHIELDEATLHTWLYHPKMIESIVDTVGLTAYQTMSQESAARLPLYHEHTTIVFKNFLRLSNLIS